MNHNFSIENTIAESGKKVTGSSSASRGYPGNAFGRSRR